MKRPLFRIMMLLAVVAAIAPQAGAATVDEASAKAVALQFLNAKAATGRLNAPVRDLKLVHTQLSSVDAVTPVFYAFTISSDSGGWVLVSGDDRARSVLGYSDSGTMDWDNLPCNLAAWLDGYTEQLEWLQQHPEVTATDAAPTTLTTSTTAVEPLLTTTWDQVEPYNNQCPAYNSHTCIVGCVATAMAQIMYYHKWPLAACDTIPAYTTSTLSIDVEALPPVVFDWDNMLDDYSRYPYETYYTTEQMAAVAQLMRYCAQACEMNFGISSSSAWTDAPYDALPNYFGYDNQSIKFKWRSSFNDTMWEEMIQNELHAGRPVYYTGQASSLGHAFVIDGYDGDSLYHVNWGWSGIEDGYFALDALNTSIGDFNSSQNMVVGIRPAVTVSANEISCQMDGDNWFAINDGYQFNVDGIQSTDYPLTLILSIENEDDSVQIARHSAQVDSGTTHVCYTCNSPLEKGNFFGDHYVRLYYTLDNDTDIFEVQNYDEIQFTVVGNVAVVGDITISTVTSVIDAVLEGNVPVTISDVTLLIDRILRGDEIETITVNGVSFNMVYVEGGTFSMGATSEQEDEADDDEYPVHQVTLRDFRIGQTEVTQALWTAVMGSNPVESDSHTKIGDNYPVELVSWVECQEFITKLNELTGKKFRLPTEAEWEFAARGGNKSKGYIYAGGNIYSKVAKPYDRSDNCPQEVALLLPNELKLYDMSGNVNEWCQDWYGSYSEDAQTNPTGPETGSSKVQRGGHCNQPTDYSRVSARYNYSTISGSRWSGLRLAM